MKILCSAILAASFLMTPFARADVQDVLSTALGNIYQHYADPKDIANITTKLGTPFIDLGVRAGGALAVFGGLSGSERMISFGVRWGGRIVMFGGAIIGVGVIVDAVYWGSTTLMSTAETGTLGDQFKSTAGVKRFFSFPLEKQYQIASADPEMARFLIELSNRINVIENAAR